MSKHIEKVWLSFFLFFSFIYRLEASPSKAPLSQETYQLSICAIFQDEAPFLKEWIEFHRLVGVDHFYLYNHRSQDHYKEILVPYIQAGIVELFEEKKVARRIKLFNRLQCKCYGDCLAKARGKSKWVAFIDIDEFLYPVQGDSLPELLKSYEAFGGVYANWRLFGTSGIKNLQKNELMIHALTACSPKHFPANRYIKSIVRPECADFFPNPHHPVYIKGLYQVNTDKVPFEGAFLSTHIRDDKLRINHYWTRDEAFFDRQKMQRQKRWGASPNRAEILAMLNKEKDETILRFVPKLKTQLAP